MDLALAVSKTKAYGAFFRYPLSEDETHFWLISSKPYTFSQIKKYLSPLSQKELAKKTILQKNTQNKEKIAREILKIARFIPFIRLIALTGSVAANNSKQKDDLDLLIITSANTLWLVRPIFLLFLSLTFSRRHPGDSLRNTKDAFCPNLWLDTNALLIPKNQRNIYTAHEVLQIKPILDRGHTHLQFLKKNSWSKKYLANAFQKLTAKKILKTKNNSFKYLLPLNTLLFVLQYLYMLPKKTTEIVTLHSAFFHKNNLAKELSSHLQNYSL